MIYTKDKVPFSCILRTVLFLRTMINEEATSKFPFQL